MAESLPSLGMSTLEGPDQLPDAFCEPCYTASDKVKPVAGYCINCDEKLCKECFISHKGYTSFRSHKLVKTSATPNIQPTTKNVFNHKVTEYMPTVALIIVAIVLTSILNFHTEEMSKLAKNIENSKDVRKLKDVVNDVKKLQDEFVDLMTRTENHADIVKREDFTKMENIVMKQINKLSETLKENNENESLFIAMKHALQDQWRLMEEKLDKRLDKFANIMTKTEIQAELAKRKYFRKIEKIVMDQINKLAVQLEKLKENSENESLLIAMKLAQDQHQLLEEKLEKLDKDNTVMKLKATLKVKRPIHVKNITVTASSDQPFDLYGSLVLPNKQILITDWQNKKLKLIDTNKDKIISEIQLSGNPFDITKVKEDEVAVTVSYPHIIQFVSVYQIVMSKVRELTVDGKSRGIAYNDRDKTLIVTFIEPPKVKMLDIKGNEIKCIEHDAMGDQLFSWPEYVALIPDMTNIYVTDFNENYVTLMSLNGDVKAVYDSDTLNRPDGVYVHTLGLVYVVGGWSHTVHEFDPESGEFKVILEKKDGLLYPDSISYCEIEDKMYIGMSESSVLKVFQMK